MEDIGSQKYLSLLTKKWENVQIVPGLHLSHKIPERHRREMNFLREQLIRFMGADVLINKRDRPIIDARRIFVNILDYRHTLFPGHYSEDELNSKHVIYYLMKDRASIYHYVRTFYLIEGDKQLFAIFELLKNKDKQHLISQRDLLLERVEELNKLIREFDDE